MKDIGKSVTKSTLLAIFLALAITLLIGQPVHAGDSSTGRIQVQTHPGAHTVVQWQDSAGNWHDVEGWRSQSTSGTVTWAVEEKDFGSGPFRWISTTHDGRIVAASYAFNLPQKGQTVHVHMGRQWQRGHMGRDVVHPRAWTQQQSRQWSPPRQWQRPHPQRVHPQRDYSQWHEQHPPSGHPQWHRCQPHPRHWRYANPHGYYR